jgi:hypothetical protein
VEEAHLAGGGPDRQVHRQQGHGEQPESGDGEDGRAAGEELVEAHERRHSSAITSRP